MIVTANLHIYGHKITILGVYILNENTVVQEKDTFYE